MPLFDVTLGREVYQRATVEVEADTREAAEVEALRLGTLCREDLDWDERESNGPKVERVEERR